MCKKDWKRRALDAVRRVSMRAAKYATVATASRTMQRSEAHALVRGIVVRPPSLGRRARKETLHHVSLSRIKVPSLPNQPPRGV
eukprot:4784007-Pyramimonas_sp.AAC.2